MADFAIWAVAAEQGRGEARTFLRAYTGARAASDEQAIEASVIGPALLALVAGDHATEPWAGTAGELLARLDALAADGKRPKEWPTNARALSGELRRLAPSLRGVGIAVTLPEAGRRGANGRRVMVLERVAAGPSQSSPPSLPAGDGRPSGDGRVAKRDGSAPPSDGPGGGPIRRGDGGDGFGAPISDGHDASWPNVTDYLDEHELEALLS